MRVAAAALLLDAAGATGALAARSLRLPRSPKAVTALVTLLRENPRFRARVRERFGASGMELLLAAANAAAHGAAQSPVSLLLDGLLRAGQLTEATARAAAFEALHDDVCRERRTSVPPAPGIRPPLRVTPAQAYAANAGTGSVAGAAATLLVTHDAGEAAEAVLAGSPKAARYGPAAFNSVLGAELARTGVLVRGGDRLRQLEIADSLVLHAEALRNLPPAEDEEPEPYHDPVHPWAEAVLDAARRAGLHVVVTGGSELKDITRLADEIAPADLPFGDAVRALQQDGHIVVSVARVPAGGDPDVADGLPAGTWRSPSPTAARRSRGAPTPSPPPDSRTSGGCSPRSRRPAASAAARRPWPVRAPRSPGCWWPAAAPPAAACGSGSPGMPR